MTDQKEQSQGTLTKQKRTAFVMSPHHLFCNSNITSEAKSLWVVLESKPEGWKFFWSEILKHFKEGRDQMIRAMGDLEKLGYIQKKRAKKGNLFSGMDIQVFYDPLLPFDPHQQNQGSVRDPEIQGTETQGPEDQSSDSQLPESQGTYKNQSKQYSSNKYLSLSKIPTLEDCITHAEKEKFLIDVEKFFKFYFVDSDKPTKLSWKQLMRSWAAKPSNHFIKSESVRDSNIPAKIEEESKEIQGVRSDIRIKLNLAGFRDAENLFDSKQIEKTSSGFIIKVEDERALKYQEVLKNINVIIEVKECLKNFD